MLLLVAATPALADPPNEDVLRPRTGGPGNLFLQLDAGLNLNWLNGNPYLRPLMSYEQETPLYKSALGLSPIIGLSLGYDFSPNFSLQLRADYDNRYVSRSASLIDTCVLTDAVTGNEVHNPMPVSKSYSLSVSYLSISLLPAYRFDNLFIYAGPTVSLPLSRTLKETDNITDDGPCYYLAPGPDTTKSVTGSLTNSDNVDTRFSLKVGVGYIFPVTSSIDFIPQAGFDFGLNGLFKNDENLVMSNPASAGATGISVPINHQSGINSLQVTLGLRFHL
jgi:hypothetical protein